MATQFIWTFAQFTSLTEPTPNMHQFGISVADSSIVPTITSQIMDDAGAGSYEVNFSTDLSGAEETTLFGIRDAHTGDPPNSDVANTSAGVAVDPTVNDDEDQGITPGYRWFNSTTGVMWYCTDATAGAAVWKAGVGELTNVERIIYNAEHNNGNLGATPSINWANGQTQRGTLTADITTLTITDPSNPMFVTFKFIQNGTGLWTITWPSKVQWANGVAQQPSLPASSTSLLTAYFDGTNYLGAQILGGSGGISS